MYGAYLGQVRSPLHGHAIEIVTLSTPVLLLLCMLLVICCSSEKAGGWCGRCAAISDGATCTAPVRVGNVWQMISLLTQWAHGHRLASVLWHAGALYGVRINGTGFIHCTGIR